MRTALVAALVFLVPALAFADLRPAAEPLQLQPGVLLGGGDGITAAPGSRVAIAFGSMLVLGGAFVGSGYLGHAIDPTGGFPVTFGLLLLSTGLDVALIHAIAEAEGLHAPFLRRLGFATLFGVGFAGVGTLVGLVVGKASGGFLDDVIYPVFGGMAGWVAGVSIGLAAADDGGLPVASAAPPPRPATDRPRTEAIAALDVPLFAAAF